MASRRPLNNLALIEPRQSGVSHGTSDTIRPDRTMIWMDPVLTAGDEGPGTRRSRGLRSTVRADATGDSPARKSPCEIAL